jgi:hypothetical protein
MTSIPHNSIKDTQLAFKQGQLDALNHHEAKHDQEPSSTALFIALAMSLLESGFAFVLLLPAGLIAALTGAAFPVALLWAMAFVHAKYVEFPQALTTLEEEYHDTLNS